MLTRKKTYGKLRISLKERRKKMNFMVNLLVIISILVISIILLVVLLGIEVVIRNNVSLLAGNRKSSFLSFIDIYLMVVSKTSRKAIKVAYHIGKDRTLKPAADLTAGFLVTAKGIFSELGRRRQRI